ncbi:hypothetical protein SSPIM334S_01085 [Streptomyces spiroverticillatus]
MLVAVATEEPPPVVRAGPLAPLLTGLLRKDPAERLTMTQLRALLAQPTTAPAFTPTDLPTPSPVPQPRTVTAMTPAPIPPPSPAAPRPRRPARPKVLGAVVALVVLAGAAAAVLLTADAFNTAYQDNLRAADSSRAPDAYRRVSEARTDGDRARVTYTATCKSDGECGSRADDAHQWLVAHPGVAAVAFTRSSPCLTAPEGCEVAVTPTAPNGQPAVRRAVLRLNVTAGSARRILGGEYRLEVDFGR